jgi:hypothetical protein
MGEEKPYLMLVLAKVDEPTFIVGNAASCIFPYYDENVLNL